MKVYITLSLYFIFSINIIHCDIPVHCLKSQISGVWEFYATPPKAKDLKGKYETLCGHHRPSHESTSFKFNLERSLFTLSFKVELHENDKAVFNSTSTGKWTMVYDEGFHMTFQDNKEDRSYFAFSRYGPKNDSPYDKKQSKWYSYCYETLIGWYHIGDNWGCFYGIKQGVEPNTITNLEASNKQIVVEGVVKNKEKEETVYIEGKKDDTPNKGLKSFLEAETRSTLSITSQFTEHNLIVDLINSDMDSSWKAVNYDQFSGMTLEELNEFAGRRKLNIPRERKLDAFRFKSTNRKLNFRYEDEFLEWRNFMSEPRNQGKCGSCYAVATLSMLEARIRIKYPEIVEKYFPEKNSLSLSLEHIMKYSYYNQGCDGGYAYLTLKFFHEFELLHSKCFDDTDSKYESKCQDPKLEELVLSVKNYYYVGGSYGKCSEHAIMEEVRKNGPIVVSFEPDYSFMFYSHGIYQAPDRDSWVTKKISKPEWQKVDHSVVLVGWGVEKGQKYWLIQNSWGPDWGDGGYLKFLRGEDHLGIESICEVGTPMVLVKKPKQ